MATPFEAHRGTLQQRVDTALAATGDFAYELGHATHLDANLAVGDRHDLSQDFVLPAQAALVRMTVRIVAPPELPSGMAWEFQVLLNGTQHYARRISRASRVLVLSDIVVRLAEALAPPDTNTLTLRLRLV